DHVSDGGVVKTALIAIRSDCRWSHRVTHAEAHCAAPGVPAVGKGLHRNLHINRKSKTMVRRVLARGWRIDEDHQSVAGEPDQGGFMAGRDGSKGFIIFP